MKTILICGPAPCLHADMTAAARPGADTMAVNAAAGAVERADYLFTLHPEIMHRLVLAQHQLTGCDRLDPEGLQMISVPPRHGIFRPLSFPVTQWIGIDERGATSGIAAVFAAAALGYDDIILCGVPLTGGDGGLSAPGLEYGSKGIGNQHPDGPTMARIQQNARGYAADLARRFPAVRVYSMSGFTREILPPPRNVVKALSNDIPRGDKGTGNGEKREGRTTQ